MLLLGCSLLEPRTGIYNDRYCDCSLSCGCRAVCCAARRPEFLPQGLSSLQGNGAPLRRPLLVCVGFPREVWCVLTPESPALEIKQHWTAFLVFRGDLHIPTPQSCARAFLLLFLMVAAERALALMQRCFSFSSCVTGPTQKWGMDHSPFLCLPLLGLKSHDLSIQSQEVLSENSFLKLQPWFLSEVNWQDRNESHQYLLCTLHFSLTPSKLP